MRVLITGCAGFIGSNLADRLLRKGHSVVGVDNLSYGLASQIPEGVEFHNMDIRDPALSSACSGVDVVFHLAAKNCITDCQQDPVETADINVTGSANVFQAAHETGVGKVVYAESSALYEGSTVLPTPESEEAPESFYALSKQAERLFALGFEQAHGLPMTALRYFCVYGPRQDYRRTIPPVMSAFIMKLLQGEAPIIYGTGEKRRDFVHVDDVNDFHELCMHRGPTDGNAFNVGSGVNYSIRDIYQHISDLLGVDIPPQHEPDFPEEAQETLADITLAKSVGWAPRVSLVEGLKTMEAFIRERVLAS